MKKKNIIEVIFLLLILMSIVSCRRLSTPEELMRPPELNVENKQIKDAIGSLLPQGAVLYTPLYVAEQSKSFSPQEQSFITQDFDNDGEEEVISLYQNSRLQNLGIIVLKKENGLWIKNKEIQIKSIEVLDYNILDIDNDEIYEIVIGYIDNHEKRILSIFQQENDGMKEIFHDEYYSFEFSDLNSEKDNYLITSNFTPELTINKVNLFKVKKGFFEKIDEISYPSEMEPYHIQVGKVDKQNIAIFVDMYVNNSYGKTDVLLYDNEKLKTIIVGKMSELVTQNYPIPCIDIDGDGILEIPHTENVSPSNLKKSHLSMDVNNYYKVVNLSSLKLVRQIYEDPYEMNIKIDFPREFWNRYYMVKDAYSSKITLYYRTDDTNESSYYPLMELYHIDIAHKEKYSGFSIIDENDYYVTLSHTMDSTAQVPKEYVSEYKKLLQLAQSPEKFIKRLE